jgi:hypothetical protein
MSCACGQIWRSCRSGRSGRATSVGVSESVDPYLENYGYITCIHVLYQLYPKTPQGKNHVITGSYHFIYIPKIKNPSILDGSHPCRHEGPGDHEVVLKQPRLVTTGDPFFFSESAILWGPQNMGYKVYPICSVYGIFTYICAIFGVNVVK